MSSDAHGAEPAAEPDGIRLQKVMAAAGVASRRASEILIGEGRVAVNGRIITEPGLRIDPEVDRVTVDGVAVQIDTSRRYVMLNKPTGVVSSLHDDQGKRDLREFTDRFEERLFNVGRLDGDTSGLLLLTNDGELAHTLAHPSFGVEKTYVALVRGELKPKTLGVLTGGIELADGPIAADKARILSGGRPDATLVEVTLHSGRNRIVRRMFDAVGHPVQELVRRRFGPLTPRDPGARCDPRPHARGARRDSDLVEAGDGRSRWRSRGTVDSSAVSARTTGQVRIVGSGLLGTSIGLGLVARDVDVILDDLSPSALGLAVDYGAGRKPAAGDQPSLVVVAVPPDRVAEVVAAELVAHPDALVTDVASVKAAPLAAVRAAGAPVDRYLGSHPMAGRERSGPIAGRADLFLGRPWVITPHATTTDAQIAVIESLALDLDAVPVRLDPDRHDAAVAVVSHVPQVLASLVAGTLLDAPASSVALAGQGLRDVTRIASSDPALWLQILDANAARVVPVLAGIRDELDRLVTALGDPGAPGAQRIVADALAAGNRGVERIPGKARRGPAPPTLVVLIRRRARRTRPPADRDRVTRRQPRRPAPRALARRTDRHRGGAGDSRSGSGPRSGPRRPWLAGGLVSTSPIVVAVDGPAGSGKSSVSRAAARELDFRFLDTGSLYRALAWFALESGVDLEDAQAIETLLDGFAYTLETYPADARGVVVDGTDVTAAIRTPRVTGAVSAIAKVPAVRTRVNDYFRAVIASDDRGVVVEGRDITTVVAPDAAVRVLLTASPEVRAARRAGELGRDTHEVAKAIAERDAKDSRVVDFMTAAEGVTTLDSTDLDFAQTVQALVSLVGKATT